MSYLPFLAPAATSLDLVLDHPNGKKVSVTTSGLLLTPVKGHLAAYVTADGDAIITTSTAVAVDNGTGIRVIANQAGVVIPIIAGQPVYALSLSGSAITVRITPMKLRTIYAYDTLSATAAGLWGLSRRSGTWTGACINVRRSSDNTAIDIGFSGKDLDTSSLNSFVGSGSGFITTEYDQSGNGMHLTQTTAANQPTLVTSGVLNLLGGRPAALFNGTSTSLSTAPITTTSSQMTVRAVVNLPSTGTAGQGGARIVSMFVASAGHDYVDPSQIPFTLRNSASVAMFRNGTTVIVEGVVPVIAGGPTVLAATYAATTATLDINGKLLSSPYPAAPIGSPFSVILGAGSPGDSGYITGSVSQADLILSALPPNDQYSLRHEDGAYHGNIALTS